MTPSPKRAPRSDQFFGYQPGEKFRRCGGTFLRKHPSCEGFVTNKYQPGADSCARCFHGEACHE